MTSTTIPTGSHSTHSPGSPHPDRLMGPDDTTYLSEMTLEELEATILLWQELMAAGPLDGIDRHFSRMGPDRSEIGIFLETCWDQSCLENSQGTVGTSSCEWFMRAPVAIVRFAPACASNLPPGVLLNLSGDPSMPVRLAAARNPEATDSALWELSKDRSHAVCRAVAEHPNTDMTVRVQLFNVGCVGVSVAAADGILAASAVDDVVEALKEHGLYDPNSEFAPHANTEAAEIYRRENWVGGVIGLDELGYHCSPAETARILRAGEVEQIRDDVVGTFVLYGEAEVDSLLARLVGGLTHDEARELAFDGEPVMRFLLACLADPSHDTLHQLANDPCWSVRVAVASHPLAPACVLTQLRLDPEIDVLKAVALHPNTTAECRWDLAHYPWAFVSGAAYEALHAQTETHPAALPLLTEPPIHNSFGHCELISSDTTSCRCAPWE